MTATFHTPNKKLTWLITGCSSGLGLSLARIVQAGGHTLIATSRSPSRTPELVSEVESKGGRWLQLDANHLNTASFIDDLEESGTQIDVLVNNAGFCIHSPIETATEDEMRAQMETMYFGPLRLIKAIIPHMRKRQFGVIANFSSGAALEGNPTMGVYAGAKAGLDGTAKVLAKEVAAFNIRVLTVVLGTFNTSFGSNAQFGKNSLPDDYKGSMTEKMLEYLSSGNVPINGDKDKAMKAVYDLVVGEGFGAGQEAERLLPLGTDMTTRVKTSRDYLQHSLDVFGVVTDSVAIDK
ncbi:NAD(P)-binding protein [Xylariaceae sp. FL1272]|nr:NAD(P)-binding protein [Xylariaceae sp. FL1272]